MSKSKIFITHEDQFETIVVGSDEREVIINIEPATKLASIYVSDNPYLTKMKRYFAANPDTVKCWEGSRDFKGRITGYMFELPAKAISLRAPKTSRELTEEQRKAIRARFVKGKEELADD